MPWAGAKRAVRTWAWIARAASRVRGGARRFPVPQPPASPALARHERLLLALAHGHHALALEMAGDGLDANAMNHTGLTPLLMAAWDGQARLLARLHALGGDGRARFQGKSIIELALESRDGDTLACAMAVHPEPGMVVDQSIHRMAQAVGMGPDLVRLVRQEARRRRQGRAAELEAALPPGQGTRKERL